MPTYQNVTPPSSLFSGDVGFSFNNEAFPGWQRRHGNGSTYATVRTVKAVASYRTPKKSLEARRART